MSYSKVMSDALTMWAECDVCGKHADITFIGLIPNDEGIAIETVRFCADCQDHALDGWTQILVKLSLDFHATCDGYHPDAEYETRFAMIVEETDAERICELMFSICNSYPDELHCHRIFAEEVSRYRSFRNRSLSVGDIVTVNGVGYSCERFGWKQIEVAS